MRAVLASTWFGARRTDSARRLRVLCSTLARHADWDDHTTWPTWDALMTETGWSRSTMSSWLAELQRLGFLLRVEQGSTPQYRPMALAHIEGNRAAVYQLRIPVCQAPSTGDRLKTSTQTRTPTHPFKNIFSRSHVLQTRARKMINKPERTGQTGCTRTGPDGPGSEAHRTRFFDLRVPQTPAQMLAAATELREMDKALWRLGPRWLRALFRPWWRAGWTNTDLLHALSNAPAIGTTRPVDRCPASQLRSPGGWVRHRMARWRTQDGAPLTAPRLWEQTRRQLAHDRGAGAAARLPYGAQTLLVENLHVGADERRAATEQLVRRWALELHEARNAPTPEELVAAEATRRHQSEEIRRHLQALPRRRSRKLPSVNASPTVSTSEPESDVWQRALEVARSEGRVARTRRRRSQW